MFIHNTLNPVVISNKIYNKNIKTKVLLFSLSILSTLFALTLYLASTPSIKFLSNYAPSCENATEVKQPEKNIKERVVKNEKTSIKRTEHLKKAEAQTLQKIAPKPLSTVPSSEAFTPQASSAASTSNSEIKSPYSPMKPISDIPNEQPAPSESSSQIDSTTLGLIRTMIQNALEYPSMAKKLKIESVVVVSFFLTQDGRVKSATILNPSGSSSLDSKAIQTVLALNGKYPTLNKEVQLQIPIAFSRNKS